MKQLRHGLKLGREYLIHWTIAGLIIAVTGIAPEHWVADLLNHVHLHDVGEFWTSHVDAVRTALVLIGVGVIGFDVWRRARADRPAATSDVGRSLDETINPAIAVLPFKNLSDSTEQDYFADGVVEDIIAALSGFSQLSVIARNSSFVYKNRDVNTRDAGQALGARYVLEGSVRRAGGTIRISGQLIDAVTGAHLWAGRFDGNAESLFDVQDQVASQIVGAITPKLDRAEIERAKRKPPKDLTAYDIYLRGMAALHRNDRESNNEALAAFGNALARDPSLAVAHAMAAYCYVWRKANGWLDDPEHDIEQAIHFASRAAELGKDDAVALCYAGFALARVGADIETGIALIDRALSLNVNMAAAWGFSGRVRVYRGEPELAIDHLGRAMRLSPLDPETYSFQGSTAFAHFFLGRYSDAASWAAKALTNNPHFLPVCAIAAAANSVLGREPEARRALERVREIDPGLRVSNLGTQLVFQRPEDILKLGSALRSAGLPE